jgi:hypothetical protein
MNVTSQSGRAGKETAQGHRAQKGTRQRGRAQTAGHDAQTTQHAPTPARTGAHSHELYAAGFGYFLEGFGFGGVLGDFFPSSMARSAALASSLPNRSSNVASFSALRFLTS